MRRLERSKEHRGTDVLLVTHDVRAPVDSVRTVDVEPPARAEHRRVARGRTAVRVARRVVRRISLRLDDHTAHTVDE